jgi:hypothetical protein
MSIRKPVRLALVLLLITVSADPGAARSRPQNDPPAAEKVRAKVAKLGTGKRSRAEVTLKDDRRLKGYIGEISENSFTLVDPKRGSVTSVAYDQVRHFKSDSHGGRDLALVLGGTAGIIIFVLAIANTAR